MRFPLQGVVHLKLPTFLAATALQRKLSLADFSPPYRFIRRRRGYGGLVCLWAFSFHCQFHDLRLILLGHCGSIHVGIHGLGFVHEGIYRFADK